MAFRTFSAGDEYRLRDALARFFLDLAGIMSPEVDGDRPMVEVDAYQRSRAVAMNLTPLRDAAPISVQVEEIPDEDMESKTTAEGEVWKEWAPKLIQRAYALRAKGWTWAEVSDEVNGARRYAKSLCSNVRYWALKLSMPWPIPQPQFTDRKPSETW